MCLWNERQVMPTEVHVPVKQKAGDANWSSCACEAKGTWHQLKFMFLWNKRKVTPTEVHGGLSDSSMVYSHASNLWRSGSSRWVSGCYYFTPSQPQSYLESKQVTWCFTPNQPVQLNQGEHIGKNSSSNHTLKFRLPISFKYNVTWCLWMRLYKLNSSV